MKLQITTFVFRQKFAVGSADTLPLLIARRGTYGAKIRHLSTGGSKVSAFAHCKLPAVSNVVIAFSCFNISSIDLCDKYRDKRQLIN